MNNIEKRWIYISYFWRCASKEQIEDMLVLPVDLISEYILTLGKELYEKNIWFANKNKKSIIELWKLHQIEKI